MGFKGKLTERGLSRVIYLEHVVTNLTCRSDLSAREDRQLLKHLDPVNVGVP